MKSIGPRPRLIGLPGVLSMCEVKLKVTYSFKNRQISQNCAFLLVKRIRWYVMSALSR